MKYMMTFLGLFVVCLVAYMILWMGVTAGQILGLTYLMMPVGLGMGAFFILFLVCLVFKK